MFEMFGAVSMYFTVFSRHSITVLIAHKKYLLQFHKVFGQNSNNKFKTYTFQSLNKITK